MRGIILAAILAGLIPAIARGQSGVAGNAAAGAGSTGSEIAASDAQTIENTTAPGAGSTDSALISDESGAVDPAADIFGDMPLLSLPKPPFHIQLWDAHKTEWNDARLGEVADAGFTIVQNGWRGSLFPSPALLKKVSAHGLLYGAYIDTRALFANEATQAEMSAVRHAVEASGIVRTSEFNTFDPTYADVVARAMRKALAQLAQAETLYKIMLNSERNAPISYDGLTVAEAVKAGAMEKGARIPLYDRGVYANRAAEGGGAIADPWRFLMWFDARGGDRAINFAAAEAAHAARPLILVTTDPLADAFAYGQYRGMDILQDWVRVHKAPRDPLSIAYRCERLKAHVRHEGRGEIWIGPQLGTKEDATRYAAPADEFEEALWLAVAFGARGATIWGYDTVRRDNPLDMDTWWRVRKFRNGLIDRYQLLLRATDAPRTCAVLLSKANQVFTTGPYYEVEENYEHFYRVLLTAHVPTDVLYDEDVLAGRLANYRALFLPGIEHSTPELDAAIARFEKSGGRVIRWPKLAPRYRDYEITKGNVDDTLDVSRPGGADMLPHQYRRWRQLEAAKVFEKAADLMDVRVDNPNVILNVVEVDGERFAVLVNDSRTYGEWTRERGYRWCEDAGVATEATLTFGADSKMTVSLPPAGIAVEYIGPPHAR